MIYNKITTIKILFQKKNKDCFKDQHKALMIFTKKKKKILCFSIVANIGRQQSTSS